MTEVKRFVCNMCSCDIEARLKNGKALYDGMCYDYVDFFPITGNESWYSVHVCNQCYTALKDHFNRKEKETGDAIQDQEAG